MEDDEVEQVKVHTKENPIDVLIKVLPWDSFQRYMALMQLVDKTELAKTLKHQGRDCWVSCGASKAQ